MRLLVASRNAGKLAELRRILDAAGLGGAGVGGAGVVGVELVGLADVAPFAEAPETAPDFEGNALAKARDGAAATGLACVADDSGISVDALNGMPGVLSARWSGRHGDDGANTALLLAQLADVPDERRGAEFVCAAALVTPDGQENVVRGQWSGRLARTARGSGGFGYDPVFVPGGSDRSAAELTPAEKDAASHRGRALAQLVPVLAALAGQSG